MLKNIKNKSKWKRRHIHKGKENDSLFLKFPQLGLKSHFFFKIKHLIKDKKALDIISQTPNF